MANMYNVTRTFKKCEVVCKVVDIETGEIFEKRFPSDKRSVEDYEHYRFILAKRYDTPTQRIIAVTGIEHEEVLYGMTEDEFKAHATILNKDTRKPLNDTNE